ncbi:MAG: molybdenum cofactor biosynthesis protein MoaE [Actinomycetota bacterium]
MSQPHLSTPAAPGRDTHRISVRLTDRPIDASAGPSAEPHEGAIVSFVGRVRGDTDGRGVAELVYEAFDEMALGEMRRIAEEACARWPIGSVTVIHRVGRVPAGEASVSVSVTAPHRGEAFDACRFVIDTLKKTVQIWKKEQFQDGSARWVDHP